MSVTEPFSFNQCAVSLIGARQVHSSTSCHCSSDPFNLIGHYTPTPPVIIQHSEREKGALFMCPPRSSLPLHHTDPFYICRLIKSNKSCKSAERLIKKTGLNKS
ncbi:hypothetical protein AAFF_G00379120 [Aldrovandia affinis]|uniref:Uncharacterized protein n=1 Tax=Aldrovandia affinis TaxID=143900 RepID=A0AAD7WLZ7_9TELE|nr:hypothetical protein AAFF_G00379120 [Aldrovandia affinis]